KNLTFAFITDVHGAGKTLEGRYAEPNLEKFVKECNSGRCDFAAFGGDLFSAYGATRKEAMEFISVAMKHFDRVRIPLLMTKGNHDRNAKISEEETISNELYHQLCHERLSEIPGILFNPDDPKGNYFLADFASRKVRAIVLNYFDACVMQNAGIHEKQLEWLRTTALAPFGEEGWTVLLFAHNYERVGDAFWEIVEDFNLAGRGRIAGFIYGDTHEDQYAFEHGINLIGVECGYCSRSQLGTQEENCFSIFTLDPAAGLLREKRVGRGADREFRF
ncbi:MAG: metallophosphoesterase, partial [Bacteroidales bacterium]|nr:metallophosphoesterase [Bacteroidales bacterium]